MFGFEAREAFVASIEMSPRGLGADVSIELASEQRLGFTETLGKRNLTRTNIVAAAAFDAVEQAVALELIAVEGLQVPVQLLRQQESRAHLRAVAAANAWHLGAARLQVESGGGDDAIGRFHDR